MKKQKFPKELFVSIGTERNSTEWWFNANGTPDAAVEDDGPTKVATYRLVEIKTLRKKIVST